jgi:hypothetical protein
MSDVPPPYPYELTSDTYIPVGTSSLYEGYVTTTCVDVEESKRRFEELSAGLAESIGHYVADVFEKVHGDHRPSAGRPGPRDYMIDILLSKKYVQSLVDSSLVYKRIQPSPKVNQSDYEQLELDL